MTTWHNWSGTVTAHPRRVLAPADRHEIADIVREAADRGRRVKAVGSGHSFTAIGQADDVQLRLSRLSGVVKANVRTGRVRVLAGTPLHVLNPTLWALGLALPNLGDIDRQTISGALATGTHGTGGSLNGIAAAITGVAMVLADGSQIRCNAQENSDLFQAARIGLGALGIVTEYELQCVPAYRLHALEQPEPLADVLSGLDEHVDGNRHFEFYWFPHTDRTLTKRNNMVDDDDPGKPLTTWRRRLDDDILSNRVFERACQVAATRPQVVPRLNQVSARALTRREFTDRSYRVFCTQRDVRFVESEYAVPRHALEPVLRELRARVDASQERIVFPVEVRFVAADDIWMSTAYQRDTAYLAVHQYHRMPYDSYFRTFEQIVAAHDGRPHWGKMHTLDAARIRELYPRFDDFVAVRDRLDPQRVFGNDYLERVLG